MNCKKIINGVLSILLVIFALPGLANAQEKSITITTLDWPPYTGSSLPEGGAITAVVRAAFAKAGYKVNVIYRPWKRAIDMAYKGTENAVAYFPGYHCKHREGFVPSMSMGNGPLGFAENVDVPITWENLDDIGEQQLKIGTVLGYANSDEFDAKVGTGWIRAIPANNDVTNLKKLLRKRIDAVVIDQFVFEYLKVTDTSLKTEAAKLRFNARAIENKSLKLCVRDNPEAKQIVNDFNAALKQIDSAEIVKTYFETAFN